MKLVVTCLLLLVTGPWVVVGDEWDPMDDTFDPSIESVVIGDRSWIGDPSPFVYMRLSRTGYTHVNKVAYQGFDPSVQISLLVPTVIGEKAPPAGGMLMLNKAQATELIEAFETGMKTEPKGKDQRVQIKTGFKDADWALTFASDKKQRFLQLENKNKDKVETYRLSINASKKLLGAIKHSLKQLEEDQAGK